MPYCSSGQTFSRQLWGHSSWAWGLEGCTGSDSPSFRSFEARPWVHVPFLALLSQKAGASGLAALSLEIVWASQVLLWLAHPLARTGPLSHPSLRQQSCCQEGWVLLGFLQEHFLSFVTEMSPGPFSEISILVTKWSSDQLWPCALWQGTFCSCYWGLILSLNAF